MLWSLASSFLIGLVHCLVTFYSFALAGFQLKGLVLLTAVLFSLVSGFLAILPLFGSWLIWLPASLYLAFDDRWSEAVKPSR